MTTLVRAAAAVDWTYLDSLAAWKFLAVMALVFVAADLFGRWWDRRQATAARRATRRPWTGPF